MKILIRLWRAARRAGPEAAAAAVAYGLMTETMLTAACLGLCAAAALACLAWRVRRRMARMFRRRRACA